MVSILKEKCSELHRVVSIEEVDEGKTVTGAMLEVHWHGDSSCKQRSDKQWLLLSRAM